MTLDEAITHAKATAKVCANTECGQDHEQLAQWLVELQIRRAQDTAKLVFYPESVNGGIDHG